MALLRTHRFGGRRRRGLALPFRSGRRRFRAWRAALFAAGAGDGCIRLVLRGRGCPFQRGSGRAGRIVRVLRTVSQRGHAWDLAHDFARYALYGVGRRVLALGVAHGAVEVGVTS